MKPYFKGITIEELADEKLPKAINQTISKTKLTLREVVEWLAKPSFYVAVRNGELIIDVRQRWSLKKVLAIFGGIIGLLWAFIKVLVEAWPIIGKWF